MTTYGGNPASWPETIELLSDATPPTGSQINVPIEAVFDRTAFLKALADALGVRTIYLPVLNFYGAAAVGVSEETSEPFYNEADRAWIAPGAEVLRRSSDGGLLWGNVFGVPSMTGLTLVGGAANSDGGMVVSTTSRYVFTYDAGADTWSKVDVLGLDPGIEITSTRVVYDAIHNSFVWFSAHVNLLKVKHSSTGASWTAGTEPSAGSWGDDHDLLRLACTSAGRVVAIAYVDSTTTASVATSDDGGATWTVRSDITGTPSTPDCAGLVYNWIDNELIYSIGKTSTSSKVYRSTDGGVTWTVVSALSSNCIHRIATASKFWVSMVSPADSSWHFAAVSTDKGASWHPVGFAPSTLNGVGSNWAGLATSGIFAGGGGFVVPVAGKLYTSVRYDDPNLEALT